MEYENHYASDGKGNLGVTLGAIGTGLGLVNGGLSNLGIGGCNNTTGNNGCSENHFVNRYEAGQAARIAELETEVKLRDANAFTLGEMGKLRDYFEGRIAAVEKQICQQGIVNAQITANIGCMQNAINVLNGLTKTVIPIDNVCPEPMRQYNSWTAPTATA